MVELIHGRLDMFMASQVLGQEDQPDVVSNTVSILHCPCSSCSQRLWYLFPDTFL